MNRPYRIQKPEQLAQGEIRTESETTDKPEGINFYIEKLIKLIPSEILGLYLTLNSIGNTNVVKNENDPYFVWISIISLLLLLISRVWGTSDNKSSWSVKWNSVQWGGVVLSSISFIIWLYAMGHRFAGIPFDDYRLISAAVVIWTFVVPYFYQKK